VRYNYSVENEGKIRDQGLGKGVNFTDTSVKVEQYLFNHGQI